MQIVAIPVPQIDHRRYRCSDHEGHRKAACGHASASDHAEVAVLMMEDVVKPWSRLWPCQCHRSSSLASFFR